MLSTVGHDDAETGGIDEAGGSEEAGVVPIISATAHRVATCTFEVDDRDELVPGFVLR